MLHFTFQNMRAFYGPWPRGLGLRSQPIITPLTKHLQKSKQQCSNLLQHTLDPMKHRSIETCSHTQLSWCTAGVGMSTFRFFVNKHFVFLSRRKKMYLFCFVFVFEFKEKQSFVYCLLIKSLFLFLNVLLCFIVQREPNIRL